MLDMNDAVLVLRDAIFFEDYIFIGNGYDIILTKDDIELIDYTKPNFFNRLFAATSRACFAPGYLWIDAKVEVEGKKKPKRKTIGIKIKYEEVFKVPEKFQPIGWCK